MSIAQRMPTRGARTAQSVVRARIIRAGAAFTLTELIVVVALLAIMASLALAALGNAMTEAKRLRTATMITKIDRLIADKLGEYRYRRPRLVIDPLQDRSQGFAAKMRLYATRDLMRMELPERYSDFIDLAAGTIAAPVTLNPDSQETPAAQYLDTRDPLPLLLPARSFVVRLSATPAITSAYFQKTKRMAKVGLPALDDQHEGAECLYLVLSQMQEGDKPALASFAESEIGDTDGDGMLEILDAWGEPIQWLRWAPGYSVNPPDWGDTPFVSAPDTPNRGYAPLTSQEIFRAKNDASTTPPHEPLPGWSNAPDPIDLLRVDPRWNLPNNVVFGAGSAQWRWRPFALRPLIWSAGPDRSSDIARDYVGAGAFAYATTGDTYTPMTDPMSRKNTDGKIYRVPVDPYVLVKETPTDGAPLQPWLGACYDTNANGRPTGGNGRAEYMDNITNHAIELGGVDNK